MENMEKNNIEGIPQAVLDRIEHGHVHMRSRLYFTLKIVGYIVICVIAFILLLLVVSFIVFIVQYYGFLELPAFGADGLNSFFASFPWIFFAIALVLMFVAQRMVRHFEFAYKKPVMYSLVGVGIFSLSVGIVLISFTTLPRIFFDGDEYPALSSEFIPLHSTFTPHGFIAGTVASVDRGGLMVQESNGNLVRVVLTNQTAYTGDTIFSPGDRILAQISDTHGDEVDAYAIRKIGAIAPHRSLRPLPRIISTSTRTIPQL